MFPLHPAEQYRLRPDESILIARSKAGDEVILRALEGREAVEGYVPPCFSLHEYEELVSEYAPYLTCYEDRLAAGEALESTVNALRREVEAKMNSLLFIFTPAGRMSALSLGVDAESREAKLFSTCFKRKLEPLSLSTSGSEESVRKLLLALTGLDLIYVDSQIVVIDKPEGLLSVPGRGEEKHDSAATRVRSLFPSAPAVPTVHRLDMDTSGVMVFARTEKARRELGRQFEERETWKEYIALLEGEIEEDGGVIDMPIRLDVEHRPYQIVDEESGKQAVTEWQKLQVEEIDGELYTKVLFHPRTGRTHQIRVHSASVLGHAIKGDRLYGRRREGERLALHAAALSFTHPESAKGMTFTSKAPF